MSLHFFWTEPSNTHGGSDEQYVQIIHPFHPLRGQRFRLVVRKQLWGEERVTVEMPGGIFRSVPVAWTDAVPPDPYISVGGGRSLFRVDDLLELSRVVLEGSR